ncbi:MAG: hypothetical protein R3F24_01875 [Gammaproteobacteria bacterium]
MDSSTPNQSAPDVIRLASLETNAVEALLSRHGVKLHLVDPGAEIPGSYWGAPEAGLTAQGVYARSDTPIHSILHEAAHYICMPDARRADLGNRTDGDAGGEVAEEDAVCYLQILLAGELQAAGYGREQLCLDMDAWGYSFRLGSARRWFNEDADEALAWLRRQALVSPSGQLMCRFSQ